MEGRATRTELKEPVIDKRQLSRQERRYRSLSTRIGEMPEEERARLYSLLDEFTEQGKGFFRGLAARKDAEVQKHRLLLMELLKPNQNENVKNILSDTDYTEESLGEDLNNQLIIDLVSAMSFDTDTFRTGLGILLSMVKYDEIPEETRERLNPYLIDAEFAMVIQKNFWYLCGAAEPRLRIALRKGAAIVVNDHLVVKFYGKLSALCTKTFTTTNGVTFLAGNWYSPSDSESREGLRNAFDQGKSHVTLQSGEWALMRTIEDKDGELLAAAQDYAANAPMRLPETIGGESRMHFRREKEERH